MFGFLNVYKPKGITSHDVVNILRRITKIKQIGHAGTLDPFAEGVLPIGMGKATKLFDYLSDEKAYIGTIQFGKATTTYDIEGEITETSNKKISVNDIEPALEYYTGEIEQIPPIYSAIKVKGKKLYEYARSGESIEINPRKVYINEIKILKFDSDLNQLELFIDCSKGTYIRSIANDLSKSIGTYGHLIKLVRVKSGKFTINNAEKLDNLNSIEQISNNLISPLDYLDQQKYELDEYEISKIKHGNPINASGCNGIIILTTNGTIAAVGEANNNTIKCKRVFI